jgi:hypothetical protein
VVSWGPGDYEAAVGVPGAAYPNLDVVVESHLNHR